MKNRIYTEQDKAHAINEFKANVSELNTTISDQIKESVMDAFQDTVQSAKSKAKQALSQFHPEDFIRSNPKIVLGTAFAFGAFVGLGKLSILRPLAIAGFSFALEQWQQAQRRTPSPDYLSARDEILH